jgi:hypothetical protein
MRIGVVRKELLTVETHSVTPIPVALAICGAPIGVMGLGRFLSMVTDAAARFDSAGRMFTIGI